MSRKNPSALEGLVALAQIILSLASIPANIQSAQRKIDSQNAQIKLSQQRHAESVQKMQITSAEIQTRNNKVVLADLDIEIRKLQLLKLQRDLGLNATDFNPDDYSSDREPYK